VALRGDNTLGSISTDSRLIRSGQWLLALKGENFDCHDLLPSLVDEDIAGAIGSRPPPKSWTKAYVQVPDTLAALQALARSVREQFAGTGPVVAITGSCGKTTTRAMVELVLGTLGPIHATTGNFNNHIGLPLTLLKLPAASAACVLELGMSHLGEIAELAGICHPTVRVVTNVAAAHTEGVGGIEGVAQAKGELFATASAGDTCVLNVDDRRVAALPIPAGCAVVTFGSQPDRCDVWVDNVRAAGPLGLGTRFTLHAADEHVDVEVAAPGRHLALNAAAAAAVGVAAGVRLSAAGAALQQYRPVGDRMRVQHAGPVAVLNDAYNANPLSMAAALRTLADAQCGDQRRVALLGDMKELGSESAGAHLEILRQCLDLGVDAVGLVGPCFRAAAAQLLGPGDQPSHPGGTQVVVSDSCEELAAEVMPLLADGGLVLVKGSRSMRMETVVEKLASLQS